MTYSKCVIIIPYFCRETVRCPVWLEANLKPSVSYVINHFLTIWEHLYCFQTWPDRQSLYDHSSWQGDTVLAGGWWHWFDKDHKRSSNCIFPWHVFLPLRVAFHSGMNIQVGVWPTFSRCRGWKPQDHLVKHDVPPHRPKPAASGLRWPSATGPPEGGAVAPRWRGVSSLGLWSPRPHCRRIIPRRLCDTCAAKRGEERAGDRMFSCPCGPVETLKEHVSDFVKL